MVGDLQPGTIRFFHSSNKPSLILLGRFLGQVVIWSIFVILAVLITAIYLKSWGSLTFTTEILALSLSGLNYSLVSVPISRADCPRLGLCINTAAGNVVDSSHLVNQRLGDGVSHRCYPLLSPIGYLVPGHQLTDLVSLFGVETRRHLRRSQ